MDAIFIEGVAIAAAIATGNITAIDIAKDVRVMLTHKPATGSKKFIRGVGVGDLPDQPVILHPRARYGVALALAALYAAAGIFAFANMPPDDLIVLPASLLLGAALVAMSSIDLEVQRLPDLLTLPLIPLGLLTTWWIDTSNLIWHAIAAATGFGAFVLIAAIYNRTRGAPGLGRGDAKLFSASGAWVGLHGLPSVLLLASLSALATVLVWQLAGRRMGAKDRVAFGPFIAVGTWLVWLFGPIA